MGKSIGEFIGEKRREAKLTQKQLAEKLYVSESTISKWEKNKANPDISMVCELATILNVSEHELLSASVDDGERLKNIKARKWSILSSTWELFFLISYGITLLTCFIVNIAVSKSLDWFWIVLFSLVLSASFTTFPKYIRKYRLLLVTVSQLVSLIILLAVCCLYTKGQWFLLSVMPIIFAFVLVFLPSYLKHYAILGIKKEDIALVSVLVDIVLLLLMLFGIERVLHEKWFFNFALPLALFWCTMPVAIVVICRYVKLAKLIKSAILCFLFIPYLLLGYIITGSLTKLSFNIPVTNIVFPNFMIWNSEEMITSNVWALTMISLLISVLVQVFIYYLIRKNKR